MFVYSYNIAELYYNIAYFMVQFLLTYNASFMTLPICSIYNI